MHGGLGLPEEPEGWGVFLLYPSQELHLFLNLIYPNGIHPIDICIPKWYTESMKISLNFPDELLAKMDSYCASHNYERSEFVRQLIRERVMPDLVEMVSGTTDITVGMLGKITADKMVGSSMVEQVPVKDKVTGPSPVLPADRPVAQAFGNPPEYLWDDHNLMPVYKQGEDDQFCNVWHQKGLRQRVYLIKKFRADGSIELEGKYCRSCIEGFLKQDGHLE